MEGKITFFNEVRGEGRIVTRKEKVYPFNMDVWTDFDALPRPGMMVEFLLDSNNRVTKVISGHTSSKAENSKTANPDNANTKSSPKHQNESQKETGKEEEPDTYEINHSVQECVDAFFQDIVEILEKHQQALESNRELDFSRMKRFLFTAYYDLYEIDTAVTDPEMEKAKNELLRLEKEYEGLKHRINYPVKYAFEKIFLRNQSSYKKLENDLEYSKSQYKAFTLQEKPLLERLERKEVELGNISNKKSAQYLNVEKELKSIRKRYVDLLHSLSKLREDIECYTEELQEFKEKYYRDFVTAYEPMTHHLDTRMIKVLNVKAYTFDFMLWERAKKSRYIRQFFMDSGIEGTYSSRTFLKYYLRTLDKEKLNDQNRELFSLLKYLESIGTNNILIIKNNVESAMRCKYLIENIDKELQVHATYDAMDTLKDCIRTQPDLIMLDYNLRTTNALEYIKKYREICENGEKETTFCLFVDEADMDVLKEARRMKVKHFINSNASDHELIDIMRGIL